VLIVSLPIYFGITYVHHFNRLVVISMFLVFFTLIFFITPHIDIHILFTASNHVPIMALPIVFTSFGFLIIIPSLRSYLDDDIKKIKAAIILGSAIPLIIYILWITVVMGVIPVSGEGGLQAILTQSEPVKNITRALVLQAGGFAISTFVQIFILFAIASSFVGTSLGLYDFIADGLTIKKTQVGKIKILALTFFPPLMIVFFQNHLFLTALGFAGLISTILFGIYPVLLAWSGRYVRQLPTHYRSFVNRPIFFIMIVFCMLIIGVELVNLN
jgi:tyrosine-specific transport protein